MVLTTIPTVSPWAIIYRASGTLFAANARAQIFFLTNEGAFKSVAVLRLPFPTERFNFIISIQMTNL
jgi:hypothetical protein